MFVVQDTFKTKPGKANALVEVFTATAPHLAADGVQGHRVLVDHVADYWTVIFESTVEDLDTYFAVHGRRGRTRRHGGIYGPRGERSSSHLPDSARGLNLLLAAREGHCTSTTG